MIEIKISTGNLDQILEVLHRRAAFMVKDLVVLGRHAADDYALAGGRHRLHPGRYTYLRRQGKRVRLKKFHATGAQQARMTEHEAYHGFLDFFGGW